MTFWDFCKGVQTLMQESGDTSRVRYKCDEDAGLFIAKAQSGTVITMPSGGKMSVTVKWPHGHMAQAPVSVIEQAARRA